MLMFLKTRGIFEARFSTPTVPANVPKGMRLHQASRTCKVVGRVTEHEACRQVLLWIWQKFAVTKPDNNRGPLPDPVAALLGERRHSRLEPCRACADGTCRAMERGSRLVQMWKAMTMKANAVPPQVSVRVLLQGSGASQPTAEPRAEVTPCAGAGDSLFIALSFVKVVCIDGKEWPTLEGDLKKMGAMCRSHYVKWLDKRLLNDDPSIEGLTVREVILGPSTCSTIEEYKSEIGAPTMDARSWGGWAEIVLLAAKWKVSISLFWRRSMGEAV